MILARQFFDIMNKSSGFTLIEVLIAVALMILISGVAAPNLRVFISDNAAASLANEWIATLNLARSEAIKQATTTTICPSNGATNPSCAGNPQDWRSGWLIVDANNNLIYTRGSIDNNIIINANTLNITFQPSGFLQAGAGSITIDGATERSVIAIQNNGKAVVTKSDISS